MLGYDWPRLHAALNDLPVALFLVAVLFDVLAAVTRRAVFRQVGYWTMLTAVVGATVAVVTGLQAEDHIAHGEAVHEVMETHETLALTTLGIFAVVALWRLIRESKMGGGERGAALALSFVGVAAVVATGSYGGRLVFDHAAGIPTPVLQAEMHERSEGHHHGAGEGDEDDHDDASGSPEGAGHDEQNTPAAIRDSLANPPSGEAIDSAASLAPHRHPPGTKPHSH